MQGCERQAMRARCEGVNHGHPAITRTARAGLASEAYEGTTAAAGLRGDGWDVDEHGPDSRDKPNVGLVMSRIMDLTVERVTPLARVTIPDRS
jgi:hypothetical protein